MKTVVDAVDDVYKLLDIPAVHDAMLSGDIFPDSRPDNHRKEAISINSLPITGDQLQAAIVNVNIHVPNLVLSISGQSDNSQPNRTRIKVIADVVTPILKDGNVNNMVTAIESINLIKDELLREHFLNIRVRINSINL